MSAIGGVKFQKDITSTAASKIELSIPTEFVLWNVKSKAYRSL